jgi:hypothetical protein
MAKIVYFAFHDQDVLDFRGNVVRNSSLTKPDSLEPSLLHSVPKQRLVFPATHKLKLPFPPKTVTFSFSI